MSDTKTEYKCGKCGLLCEVVRKRLGRGEDWLASLCCNSPVYSKLKVESEPSRIRIPRPPKHVPEQRPRLRKEG